MPATFFGEISKSAGGASGVHGPHYGEINTVKSASGRERPPWLSNKMPAQSREGAHTVTIIRLSKSRALQEVVLYYSVSLRTRYRETWGSDRRQGPPREATMTTNHLPVDRDKFNSCSHSIPYVINAKSITRNPIYIRPGLAKQCLLCGWLCKPIHCSIPNHISTHNANSAEEANKEQLRTCSSKSAIVVFAVSSAHNRRWRAFGP